MGQHDTLQQGQTERVWKNEQRAAPWKIPFAKSGGTTLGVSVVPLVYMIMARSCGLGSVGCTFAEDCACRSPYVYNTHAYVYKFMHTNIDYTYMQICKQEEGEETCLFLHRRGPLTEKKKKNKESSSAQEAKDWHPDPTIRNSTHNENRRAGEFPWTHHFHDLLECHHGHAMRLQQTRFLHHALGPRLAVLEHKQVGDGRTLASDDGVHQLQGGERRGGKGEQ